MEVQQTTDVNTSIQGQSLEGGSPALTRNICTPFSQKERQEAKLKLQAAMENSMELPAEETIAQLKADITQAEQYVDQAVHVQAAKE